MRIAASDDPAALRQLGDLFVYVTPLGVQAWRRADEPAVGSADDRCNFDLAPWLAEGRVRWCDPGTDGTKLSTDSPATCPFINLSGARSPQVIRAMVTTPPDASEHG